MSVDEWIKLPSLIGHFKEHRLAEPNLSFLEFFEQHYNVSRQEDHKGAHSHSKLPFKSDNHQHLVLVSTLLVAPEQLQFIPVHETQEYDLSPEKLQPFSTALGFGTEVPFDFFQPPRA
jgi:hypothetical protein